MNTKQLLEVKEQELNAHQSATSDRIKRKMRSGRRSSAVTPVKRNQRYEQICTKDEPSNINKLVPGKSYVDSDYKGGLNKPPIQPVNLHLTFWWQVMQVSSLDSQPTTHNSPGFTQCYARVISHLQPNDLPPTCSVRQINTTSLLPADVYCIGTWALSQTKCILSPGIILASDHARAIP